MWRDGCRQFVDGAGGGVGLGGGKKEVIVVESGLAWRLSYFLNGDLFF